MNNKRGRGEGGYVQEELIKTKMGRSNFLKCISSQLEDDEFDSFMCEVDFDCMSHRPHLKCVKQRKVSKLHEATQGRNDTAQNTRKGQSTPPAMHNSFPRFVNQSSTTFKEGELVLIEKGLKYSVHLEMHHKSRTTLLLI